MKVSDSADRRFDQKLTFIVICISVQIFYRDIQDLTHIEMALVLLLLLLGLCSRARLIKGELASR